MNDKHTEGRNERRREMENVESEQPRQANTSRLPTMSDVYGERKTDEQFQSVPLT